jgi:hypothetical protein
MTPREWWRVVMGLYVVFALGASPGSALAKVYTYMDPRGVVHFTNSPAHGGKEFAPSGDDLSFGGGQESRRYANTPRMWTAARLARSTRFDALTLRAARRYRLPGALVKAVIAAESGFKPNARSHAGACGLMQLMPETARQMNVNDIFDPEENVLGGARYLRYLINAFAGDVRLAIAAYNAGPSLVSRLGRVPNIPETKGYVRRVLSLYRAYKKTGLSAKGGDP